MVSLVPVDSAYDLGADIVIAVDVTGAQGSDSTNNQIPTMNSLSDFWGFLETNIMATNLTTNRSASNQSERDRADVVITPNVGRNSSIDTRQRRNLIQAGAQATTPQINAIKQLIQEKSSSKYATL